MFVEFLKISHFKKIVLFRINPFNSAVLFSPDGKHFLPVGSCLLPLPSSLWIHSQSGCFYSLRGYKESHVTQRLSTKTTRPSSPVKSWCIPMCFLKFTCVWFFFFFPVFIYLAVLGLLVEHGNFHLCCGMWDPYLWHVGSSSLTRDGTQAPCIGSVES